MKKPKCKKHPDAKVFKYVNEGNERASWACLRCGRLGDAGKYRPNKDTAVISHLGGWPAIIQCRVCKKGKARSAFEEAPRNKTGRRATCKSCIEDGVPNAMCTHRLGCDCGGCGQVDWGDWQP